SVAVEIDEFREGSEPVYIRAVVFVERDSQKGIVIGEGGRTIKALGAAARAKIAALLGGSVYLELHVKVLPKWRRHEPSLKRLGSNRRNTGWARGGGVLEPRRARDARAQRVRAQHRVAGSRRDARAHRLLSLARLRRAGRRGVSGRLRRPRAHRFGRQHRRAH